MAKQYDESKLPAWVIDRLESLRRQVRDHEMKAAEITKLEKSQIEIDRYTFNPHTELPRRYLPNRSWITFHLDDEERSYISVRFDDDAKSIYVNSSHEALVVEPEAANVVRLRLRKR